MPEKVTEQRRPPISRDSVMREITIFSPDSMTRPERKQYRATVAIWHGAVNALAQVYNDRPLELEEVARERLSRNGNTEDVRAMTLALRTITGEVSSLDREVFYFI